MANKKDLILSAVVALCLMITLFSNIISSQAQTKLGQAQTNGENLADPWCDLDDDGDIDEDDLWTFCENFITYWKTGTFNPTKNVNVTNWPEDRPRTIKKAIERVVVQETFSYHSNGWGVSFSTPVLGWSNNWYWFDFEPKGELISVSEIYVNVLWRGDLTATETTPNIVYLYFYNQSNPSIYTGFRLGAIGASNMATNDRFKASAENPSFDFSLIVKGINELSVNRFDFFGQYLYIFRLELFIEYSYLG